MAANFLSSEPSAPARAPASKKWGGKDEQMFYSRAKGTELTPSAESDKIDYFIGPDGKQTFMPDRHVHVIHDEREAEVILVLTDRTQTGDPHIDKITLKGDPSGNEVNAAIEKLLAQLNRTPPGPNTVASP